MNIIKKIVIDTNIFISMVLGSKNSQKLFSSIISGEFLFITSEKQLDEIEEVGFI